MAIDKEKKPKEPDRILIPGRPDLERCDNKVVSARYTMLTFIPVATLEQFRRFANIYFLVVGCIMAVGYYSEEAFESAISPWTTLGPLAFVISISLLVEGSADYKRHRNDAETNNAPCVIMRRAQEIDSEEGAERDERIIKGKDVIVNINKAFYAGATAPTNTLESMDSTVSGSASQDPPKNVRVGFQKVRRMDIRQGHFVLVKNREMVPADIVLLASSNDGGSAYIETSSIDGETNLKLRTSPHLPRKLVEHLRDGTPMDAIDEESGGQDDSHEFESIDAATKRLTRFSCLGRPHGDSVLEHPEYKATHDEPLPPHGSPSRASRISDKIMGGLRSSVDAVRRSSALENQGEKSEDDGRYVAALTTEPPNPSVHTFNGRLTLPPFEPGGECFDIPLGADNVLLRGAVIRNTEWVIGLAFFTGTDTKLIQNSFETPSKFSQLDRLMNWTVACILMIMVICIASLASLAVDRNGDKFDELWYAGFNKNENERWPYLPELAPPEWDTSSAKWIQFFFLYVTLLNNFIPLSLYVTVEFITFCMLWFIYADLRMYDDTTNTRAVARSTIVTDLGRVQYIFSDKTGTLTQNVMRFKRCSVDGMVFGAPIQKTRPGAEQQEEEETSSFHPLRQLLVGRFKRPSLAGLEGLGGSASDDTLNPDNKLTFNAEMFLRVMSLCHTVVVEKDMDQQDYIGGSMSISSNASQNSAFARASNKAKSLFRRKRTYTNGSGIGSPLSAVSEEGDYDDTPGRGRTSSVNSLPPGQNVLTAKGPDGAPIGFAYQAESPDEGALVSAASSTFGFQVVTRDSQGIKLRTTSPSHLQDKQVTDGLKSGKMTLKKLAAETASELDGDDEPSFARYTFPDPSNEGEPREETWSILAVNKFDSDRKRMSILLRSPPELGSVPILFCKGADSAMLDPEVVSSGQMLQQHDEMPSLITSRPTSIHERERDVSALSTVSENDEGRSDAGGMDEDDWEMAQMLGIQAHLGDFASEGLRTLVLGMRVLSESECSEWLEEYHAAATSMKNRSEMLTAAAVKIERGLHIAGATAIEDKLQRGVPDTIATLEKAGIKLWVLTGDKRETAVEIGYSTHVLTPKMHLTEVPDNGKLHVRTQMAMEFIRLVKMGRLLDYQKVSVDGSGRRTWRQRRQAFLFAFAKFLRVWVVSPILWAWAMVMKLLGCKSRSERRLEMLAEKRVEEKNTVEDNERRRRVRECADRTIKQWLETDEGKAQSMRRGPSPYAAGGEPSDELSLTSEETPMVFNRASSAKSILKDIRSSGRLSHSELRKLSIAHLTAQQTQGVEEPVVDEDTLSLDSFFPGDKDDLTNTYDKKKRTLFERMFAIDRQVRKGQLKKHVHKEKLAAIDESKVQGADSTFMAAASEGPRALVIEGAALKHLLGDYEMEQILFAVASNCEAVIACRVSPQQKALLVNLVRHNVRPEPITLAIGDGANDVGMIQEAHVGVGISGKEGKQAVNASDFSIAQFRFLEDLVLIHGRWDFFRLSTVVLFSFYKNAVMAGCLILYTGRTVYSGTPLFDEWLIAMLNFVAAAPIIMTGLFDRCLSKKYVKNNPEVYKATRENELITFRTLLRWIILVFVHIATLFFFTVPQQSFGGGITSAFSGLMRNDAEDIPGNGEGGDLKSVGTVTFSCLVFLLAYKVLFETRSLIHGRWPACRCPEGTEEGPTSRLAYTWIGVTFLSIGFYLAAISFYQVIGRWGPSSFSRYVDTVNHVLGMRSMSWMLILFVPISGMIFDVSGKVFSNMYYPTQTQIHLEIESRQKMGARRQRRQRNRPSNPVNSGRQMAEP